MQDVQYANPRRDRQRACVERGHFMPSMAARAAGSELCPSGRRQLTLIGQLGDAQPVSTVYTAKGYPQDNGVALSGHFRGKTCLYQRKSPEGERNPVFHPEALTCDDKAEFPTSPLG